MTIEALLQSIDTRLEQLVKMQGTVPAAAAADPFAGVGESAQPPAASTPAEPARRGRGRPPKNETPPPAAPASTPAAAPDPFDDPPPPPAKAPEKADVRAALEAYRGRLKTVKQAQGVAEAEAQNFATQRVLAWLKSEFGTTTLAGLAEKDYAAAIEKSKTAQ